MALTPKKMEWLELYLDGQLDEKDRLLFETEIASDTELQAELEKDQLLLDGFAALEMEDFQTQMQSWETNSAKNTDKNPIVSIHQKNTTPKIITIMQKYWIAAALFAAVSAFTYWSFSNTTTADSLFADNFTVEEVQPQLTANRGGASIDPANPETVSSITAEENKMKVLLNSGVDAYNQKNYSDAVLYFESYLKGGTNLGNEREIRFYMGISYLSQNNVAKAKEIFKDLSQQSLSIGFEPMRQSSEWYLALTLLKEGDVAQAKKRLTKIANENTGHPYLLQAKTMLEKMQKHNIG